MIVPTSSLQACNALSHALFRLARPTDNPGDVAQYYCECVTHPVTEQSALNVPTMPLWISPDADEHALDAIFAPWIAAGQMQPSELAALQSVIVASRGAQIVPVEFLSLLPTFAAVALTDEQATAAGWFGSAE